jgi:hypothetical protein
MPRVHFQNANLSQANLSQADLTEGDLSRANLKGTRFVKTYMPQINLQDADLSGADFQGAYGLNTQQVKRAKNWQKAKYDEDFRKQLGLTGSKVEICRIKMLITSPGMGPGNKGQPFVYLGKTPVKQAVNDVEDSSARTNYQ